MSPPPLKLPVIVTPGGGGRSTCISPDRWSRVTPAHSGSYSDRASYNSCPTSSRTEPDLSSSRGHVTRLGDSFSGPTMTSSEESSDVSSWLEVSGDQSLPSFAEHDWMSDTEDDDILNLEILADQQGLAQEWAGEEFSRQLLVEILQIVAYPDFSTDPEDYGIRVRQKSTRQPLLSVQICRKRRLQNQHDDDGTAGGEDHKAGRKRKRRRRRKLAKKPVAHTKLEEKAGSVRETRRFQYSVELSKLLARSERSRSRGLFRRGPIIVALRELSVVDKQDKNDRFLPDISGGGGGGGGGGSNHRLSQAGGGGGRASTMSRVGVGRQSAMGLGRLSAVGTQRGPSRATTSRLDFD